MSNKNPIAAADLTTIVEADCVKFNEKNKIDYASNLPHFPWEGQLSDHLPRIVTTPHGIHIMTWNVNNPIYAIKWMSKPRLNNDNVDEGQRLHGQFDFSDEGIKNRLKDIEDFVFDRLSEGVVVCLQEVGRDLFDRLVDSIMKNGKSGSFHTTKSYYEAEPKLGPDAYNCNLTIINTDVYQRIGTVRLDAPAELKIPDNTVCVDTLSVIVNNPADLETTAHKFHVINVHMKWGTAKKYADFFEAKIESKKSLADSEMEDVPVFICGDFNCSSRYPDRSRGVEKLTECFASDKFGFLLQNDSTRPEYTHVNEIQNAKTTYEQIDCFDYVMTLTK